MPRDSGALHRSEWGALAPFRRPSFAGVVRQASKQNVAWGRPKLGSPPAALLLTCWWRGRSLDPLRVLGLAEADALRWHQCLVIQ